MYIKIIFLGLLIMLQFCVFSQDTILLTNIDYRNLPSSNKPPHEYFVSNVSDDTITFKKYIEIEKIETYKYFKIAGFNYCISYYKNGRIMQIGAFKRLIYRPRDNTKYNISRMKTVIWLYFKNNGEFDYIKDHSEDNFNTINKHF